MADEGSQLKNWTFRDVRNSPLGEFFCFTLISSEMDFTCGHIVSRLTLRCPGITQIWADCMQQ